MPSLHHCKLIHAGQLDHRNLIFLYDLPNPLTLPKRNTKKYTHIQQIKLNLSKWNISCDVQNHTNSRSTETAGCSSKNLTSLPSKIFNVHKLINPCIVKLGCHRHFFGLIVGRHFSFYKIEPRSQVRSQVISHLTSGESVCWLFPPLLISTLLYTGIYQLSCELTVGQSDGLAQRQLVSIGFDGVRLPTFPPPSQELYYAVYLLSL